MSNKINPKDIINKQKEKFSTSKWSEFLTEEFNKQGFEDLLSHLILSVEDGKKFTPPMKDWFNDFATDPDNLKVVIVSKENATGEFANIEQFTSLENLKEQGVMFYTLGRTSIEADLLLEEWRLFNLCFIDYMNANKKDLIYVFIGINAVEYSDLISSDNIGNKVFLPEPESNFWNTDVAYNLFTDNINVLLTNRGIDTVNW